MRKKTRDNLKRIRNIYCFGDFFLNRGLALFNSIYAVIKYTAFAGIIVGMLNEAFGFQIPMDKVIIFMPLLMIVLIIAGIIDVKKVHTLQKSNEISTRYNPFLVNLIKGKNNKK